MIPLAPQHIPTFVLAGKAMFTLRSLATSSEIALRVSYAPKKKLYYVAAFIGGKVKKGNSVFLGTFFPNTGEYRHSFKSKVPKESDAAIAAEWFFRSFLFNAEAMTTQVELLHHNLCGRCGRPLKGKHQNGLGAHCAEELTGSLKIILP